MQRIGSRARQMDALHARFDTTRGILSGKRRTTAVVHLIDDRAAAVSESQQELGIGQAHCRTRLDGDGS